MLNWVQASNNQGSNQGSKKNFTKFQEGITEIRVLLENGEAPYMRWTHWMPQFSRKITCPGKGCPIDDLIRTAKASKAPAPYASSKSFSFNIWNYATNQHEIMEEGVTMVEALQDYLSETFEEFVEESKDFNIKDLIIKVRKKKNSSGKFVWSFSLKQVEPMSGDVLKAFENRYDFAEYYTPPTIEQVEQLLEVSASNPKEYVDKYNEIMGYAKREDTPVKEENEDLGVEVE